MREHQSLEALTAKSLALDTGTEESKLDSALIFARNSLCDLGRPLGWPSLCFLKHAMYMWASVRSWGNGVEWLDHILNSILKCAQGKASEKRSGGDKENQESVLLCLKKLGIIRTCSQYVRA